MAVAVVVVAAEAAAAEAEATTVPTWFHEHMAVPVVYNRFGGVFEVTR